MSEGDRGRFADDRDVEDVSAVEVCDYCGMEPCAIILVDDGEGYDWECYNCGHDPDDDGKGSWRREVTD